MSGALIFFGGQIISMKVHWSHESERNSHCVKLRGLIFVIIDLLPREWLYIYRFNSFTTAS